jgi:hypothetical protein
MSLSIIGHGILNPIQVISVLELTTKPPYYMPRERRAHESVVRNGTFWLPRETLAIVDDSLVPVEAANLGINTADNRWYSCSYRCKEGFVVPTAHGVILVRNWPDANRVPGSENLIWPYHQMFFRAPDDTPEREMVIWAYLKSIEIGVTEIAADSSPVIAGHSVHELLQPETIERFFLRPAA